MKSIVINKRFERLDDFIASFNYGGDLQKTFAKGNFIFRGHASEKYELIPSALRLECSGRFNAIALGNDSGGTEYFQMVKEYNILRRFFKLCDLKGLLVDDVERIRDTWQERFDIDTLVKNEDWLPRDLWSIAAFAQHYGLPTRLLDWTHDRFVALYFAIEDYLDSVKSPKESKNIVIWALNMNPFISQANLGLPLVFVQPVYHGNMNMIAQQGLFTLWQVKKETVIENNQLKPNLGMEVNRKPLDFLLNEYFSERGENIAPFLYKITIPSNCFKEIYHYLVDIGYDAARIYPGYEGVAKAIIHNQYLVSENEQAFHGVSFCRK